MLWSELIILRKWISLNQVTFKYHQLREDILKIENTKYLIITTHNSPSLEEAAGGPFISSLLWACGDGAATRAMHREIENDEKIILEPPEEILPTKDAKTYAAILSGLRSVGAEGVLESAGYRWTDGKFVHRVIGSSIADYYFRGRKNRENEIPYAILWKLCSTLSHLQRI